MLKAGIVGLPNVGKSTLFNAVTRTRKAAAENYPFCTIDPNVGVVTVPEPRLDTAGPNCQNQHVIIPAAIEFVDIAGLVKGAARAKASATNSSAISAKWTPSCRSCAALKTQTSTTSPAGIDPVRDIEIVNTELVLADLENVKKRREKIAKDVKRGDKARRYRRSVCWNRFGAHLNTGKPANTLVMPLAPDEKSIVRSFFLLTDKPTIFACNVKEGDLATADKNPFAQKVRDYVKMHLACEAVVISAQIESDLVDLSPEEASAYLKELGVAESGRRRDSSAPPITCSACGRFSPPTKKRSGPGRFTPVTQPRRPPGLIHTDFERGFIKAETVNL